MCEHDSQRIPARTQLFGWPGWMNLAYGFSMRRPLLSAWFVVIYAGADYLTGLRRFRLPLLFAFERGTVFVLAMVVSYNTLYAVNLETSFVPCATANS